MKQWCLLYVFLHSYVPIYFIWSVSCHHIICCKLIQSWDDCINTGAFSSLMHGPLFARGNGPCPVHIYIHFPSQLCIMVRCVVHICLLPCASHIYICITYHMYHIFVSLQWQTSINFKMYGCLSILHAINICCIMPCFLISHWSFVFCI